MPNRLRSSPPGNYQAIQAMLGTRFNPCQEIMRRSSERFTCAAHEDIASGGNCNFRLTWPAAKPTHTVMAPSLLQHVTGRVKIVLSQQNGHNYRAASSLLSLS